ncbi:lipocalin-like domain-containing protein [Bradyrhizobium sp. Gha]|uniref:lipocalin-like domain-containing protein n=1 Tax=Bradyrhizobium sp. Gha TaxID=1855318 RepID=UPI0008EC69DB|nr:lipocalin-like domain-containing protein [Bradyrhizobium sp. Gha]SFI94623.1 Lipocalin-like domain-containing protein [Bradyrhizobium sp. Gha]
MKKFDGDALVGSWEFVSDINKMAQDPTKTMGFFGSKPSGIFIFLANGRYSVILMHPDLPKFVANDRLKGTDEENMAIIRGVYAHFGRYSFEAESGKLSFFVEGSTFPNERGRETRRQVVQLDSEKLVFTNDTPPTGGDSLKAATELRRTG